MATAVTGTYPAISIYDLDNTVHLEMAMTHPWGISSLEDGDREIFSLEM